MASPWSMDEWNPEDWIVSPGDTGDEGEPTPVPGDVPVEGTAPFLPNVIGALGGPLGGGGGDSAGLSSRPSFNFRDLPMFKAPRFTFNEKFTAPDAEAVLADPGYRFRADEGQGALERSAAARGLLRSGGTLKDLSKWSQEFASQEYGNVYDRALKEFITRRDTAFGDWDRQFQGAQAEYAPLLAQWQFLSGAERDAALAGFNREWQIHQANNSGGGFDWSIFDDEDY